VAPEPPSIGEDVEDLAGWAERVRDRLEDADLTGTEAGDAEAWRRWLSEAKDAIAESLVILRGAGPADDAELGDAADLGE
jgi:hypothetical protein